MRIGEDTPMRIVGKSDAYPHALNSEKGRGRPVNGRAAYLLRRGPATFTYIHSAPWHKNEPRTIRPINAQS